MKKTLYAVFMTALLHSGFSSISLAQDELPANDAGEQADIEQNVNDMVRLLEELQTDEEMSSELLPLGDGSDAWVFPDPRIHDSKDPTPLDRIVKPRIVEPYEKRIPIPDPGKNISDKNLIPSPRLIEKSRAEKRLAPAKEVVELDSGFPESSVPPLAGFTVEDSEKKEDVEQNVNDMVKLLEEIQIKESLFLKDGAGKTEEPDPLRHFVKPEKNLIPAPGPVIKKKATINIEPANEVVRFDPDGPDSHFQLGLEHWVSKNRGEAIRQFQEVVRLDPGNAHAYWNLGLLYDEKNRGPEAIVNIKKAKSIYAKYNYSAYVKEARKRLQDFSKKYGLP